MCPINCTTTIRKTFCQTPYLDFFQMILYLPSNEVVEVLLHGSYKLPCALGNYVCWNSKQLTNAWKPGLMYHGISAQRQIRECCAQTWWTSVTWVLCFSTVRPTSVSDNLPSSALVMICPWFASIVFAALTTHLVNLDVGGHGQTRPVHYDWIKAFSSTQLGLGWGTSSTK